MGFMLIFYFSPIFPVKIQNKIQNFINIYSIKNKVLSILLLGLIMII